MPFQLTALNPQWRFYEDFFKFKISLNFIEFQRQLRWFGVNLYIKSDQKLVFKWFPSNYEDPCPEFMQELSIEYTAMR